MGRVLHTPVRVGQLPVRVGTPGKVAVRLRVWIYNLATQKQPGADARLDAIDASVRAAVEHARANDVATIYLPRIGAGIGGLRWEDVWETLEAVSTTTSTSSSSRSRDDETATTRPQGR